MDKKLLNTTDAARYLGITQTYFSQIVADKNVISLKNVVLRNRKYYTKEDLDEWIKNIAE